MSGRGRVPALDGMRGLALLGMLAWHAQITWVKGGFARMTIFFVLAGFLAASSQLRLIDGSESRPFLAFWTRRARRLLPITMLGVVVAIVATAWVGGPVARSQVVGDTISTLLSFSNWRFILQAREYGAMFESASAFQHFWSLSVEEQCFLALPLVLGAVGWAAARAPGRSRQRTAVWLVAALGAAFAAMPLVVSMSADAAYYSTVVRGGEFLAGAAFAIWWNRGSPERGTRSAPRIWDAIGLAGLAALLVVMATMERDAAWLYRGGMGLFAIPAVALLGGIVVGGPWVNRILGVRPLATLGRWAFPIYVLHWPMFLVLDHYFPTADRALLVTVELALAIAVGGIVHHLIERPLMPGTGPRSDAVSRLLWNRPRRVAGAGAAGLVVCLLAAAAVPARADGIDFAAAEDEHGTDLSLEQARDLVEGAARGEPLDEATIAAILDDPDTARPGLPVMRDPDRTGVALFGGSTALAIALGGEELAALDPSFQAIPGYSPLGCGVLDDGVRGDREEPADPEPPNPVPATCQERDLRWAATAIAHQVDVAVVAASMMDVLDWQLPGDDRWLALGDPELDEQLAEAMRSTVDALRGAGVRHVVWLTAVPPPERLGDERRAARLERQVRYGQIVAEVAAATGSTVVDLADWVQALPDDEQRALTPDGVHPNPLGARRIWSELLGPAIVALPPD